VPIGLVPQINILAAQNLILLLLGVREILRVQVEQRFIFVIELFIRNVYYFREVAVVFS